MSPGLLKWYDAHKRDLPWRRSADPYGVWVSEIMLQQTRVDAVVPYYERWMQRFPDVSALADAAQDDVLKTWEGLGYYSRARNLQRGAQVVRERYNGRVPDTAELLRELPGVGAYTAGAIASIAFNRLEPAVDGNVRRVFCRLLDRGEIPAAELSGLVRNAVDPARPGDFNQALMELGATVCTPRAPACDVCPVMEHCAAYRAGTQLERPERKRKKAVPERHFATAVILDQRGRAVLQQRPANGLLGGLWEFPGAGVEQGVAAAGAAERFARAHTRAYATRTRPLATVSHTFSHFRAYYHAVEIRVAGELPDAFTLAEIEELALPIAQRKIAKLIKPLQ